MSTNRLRNTILFLGAFALTCMMMVAYGSYNDAAKPDTAESSINTNTPNTEMPWETLSRRLLGAVSF
jgi:hypothetical protein